MADPGPRRFLASFVAIAALCLVWAGCGGGGEPDSDASLPSIFVVPPLCAGAKKPYSAHPRPGGELVELICLNRVVTDYSLASIGAGARRASESSATIAYIGEPDRKSVDFSRPILEAAGIGEVTGTDGAAAMATVLGAVRESAGDDDLRSAVREHLEKAQ